MIVEITKKQVLTPFEKFFGKIEKGKDNIDLYIEQNFPVDDIELPKLVGPKPMNQARYDELFKQSPKPQNLVLGPRLKKISGLEIVPRTKRMQNDHMWSELSRIYGDDSMDQSRLMDTEFLTAEDEVLT